jgi:hypothetical protein
MLLTYLLQRSEWALTQARQQHAHVSRVLPDQVTALVAAAARSPSIHGSAAQRACTAADCSGAAFDCGESNPSLIDCTGEPPPRVCLYGCRCARRPAMSRGRGNDPASELCWLCCRASSGARGCDGDVRGGDAAKASLGRMSVAFCGAHLLMTERAERHGGIVIPRSANA